MAAVDTVEVLLEAGALNGESPVWHPILERLFWVDVRAPSLHAFDPATQSDQCWPMPQWVGCQAPSRDGVIVAMRDGLRHFDAATAALTRLAEPPYDPDAVMFNDGGCDRQGRFRVGPMRAPASADDETPEGKAGPLWAWRAGAQPGSWQPMTPAVSVSNGLAWSPDGRVMYHADTPARTIWQYDYDVSSGQADNRRVFARVDVIDTSGGPDGATVDADGFYWCAVFANACLMRFDPQGRLERTVDLPVKYPTMPAFGGEDYRTLFVTSANWRLNESLRRQRPLEGSLLALRPGVAGLAPSVFDPTR